MKKIFIFLIILVFPFLIQAEEIEVSDINLKMNLDEDFIVFTRNNLDENQALLDLNITKEYMEETMTNNNIYLNIIKDDLSYEILVMVPEKKSSFSNLTNASEDTLISLEEELAKLNNASVTNINAGKLNYVMLDYYDNNTNQYIVNYYTVVNYRGYNIQFQKKTVITDEERDEFRNIIEKIEIDSIDNIKEVEVEKPNKRVSNANIILGAIIGAFTGLVSYLVIQIINNKKSSK